MSPPLPDPVRRALLRRVDLERRYGVLRLPRVAPASSREHGEPDAARAHGTPERGVARAGAPRPAGTGGAASEGTHLDALAREVAACTRCEISRTRQRPVFGEGNPHADLLLVGEAPGADEDRTGRPFVGKAGQLLTRILAAIGLQRDEVYITNTLKCRPPRNRTPRPDEIENCCPYLRAQIERIRPRVICTLGAPAARTVLGVDAGIRELRGRVHDLEGTPVVPTYHPAYLLREPDRKRETWYDIRLVAKLLQEGRGEPFSP